MIFELNIRTRDGQFHVKYAQDYNTREGVGSAGEEKLDQPEEQAVAGLWSCAGIGLACNDFGCAV